MLVRNDFRLLTKRPSAEKSGSAYTFAALDSLACGRSRLGAGRSRTAGEAGDSSISRTSLIL